MKGAVAKRQKLEVLEEEQRETNLRILSLMADNAARKRDIFLKSLNRATHKRHYKQA